MFSSLSLSRLNVGALNVFLGAVFSFPVNLVLSVFLWTCHLQPSRPTLPPPHFSPNSDLMPTSCWPLTHILSFFFLSFFATGAFTFPLFYLSKAPPSVINIPHTNCFFSTHWEGEVILSFFLSSALVTLFLSVFITLVYTPLSLLLPFSFPPLCPFPSFPCPLSLTLLHDCMCTRRSLLISLCVCMDALGGWAALPLTCLRSQHWSSSTKRRFFAWHAI